jgi:hypothetical protein
MEQAAKNAGSLILPAAVRNLIFVAAVCLNEILPAPKLHLPK